VAKRSRFYVSRMQENALQTRTGPTLCSAGPVPIWFLPARGKRCESESGDALAEAGHLARDRILVEHAPGDATGEFRLGGMKRFLSGGLVATGDRGFHLLHEAADAADAGAIDFCAAVVAADALAGLRRTGHVCPSPAPLARGALSHEKV